MKQKSKARKWAEDILWGVCIAMLARYFLVQAFKIPSGSMKDTLLVGDLLFANKFIYGLKVPYTDRYIVKFKEPARGDIVVFRYPLQRKDFVKRCIATEGDIVEIKNKQVYVNGEPIEESYKKHIDRRILPGLNPHSDFQGNWEMRRFLRNPYVRDNFGPVKIPEGHILALGDNRDNSSDSRFWGPLDKKLIKGKALIIYFSWDPQPPLYTIWKKIRWKRIGRLIR